MFLKESSVRRWLDLAAKGQVKADDAPDWLRPFLKTGNRGQSMLGIADSAVNSARVISRFGRSGLRYNQQLDGMVSDSLQLASAIEEMSATSAEIDELSQTLLDRARTTHEEAGKGKASLTQLVSKLDSIESSIRQVGEYASDFVEKTKNIIQLTSTVNAIADQTNLLALNAAIEAARAGDHGRGFSVVADEVRGLAHRSAEAASEIESIVGGVVSGANNIEAIVAKTTSVLEASHNDRKQLVETISDAEEAADNSVEASGQIAAASTEQASVSREMAEGVQRLSDSMEQASQIFNSLFAEVEKLRELQYGTLTHFDVSDPRMLLRIAKSDHIVWVDKVIRYALFRQSSIQESELKDHTQCRLGKFLQSEPGQALSRFSRFDELFSDVHPKVHATGIDIYRRAKAGDDRESLQASVDQLVSHSDQVLNILDDILASLEKAAPAP